MASPAAAVPDIDSLARRLAGLQLPGGRFEIDAAEAAAVARLTHLQQPRPHPVFSSIASLRSLGLSIEALCGLCEFRLADGPMLGEFSASFLRPLRPGVRYRVSAIIESLDRTSSRRLGILDRLRFRVELDDGDGVAAVVVRYLWLLPRGRVAA